MINLKGMVYGNEIFYNPANNILENNTFRAAETGEMIEFYHLVLTCNMDIIHVTHIDANNFVVELRNCFFNLAQAHPLRSIMYLYNHLNSDEHATPIFMATGDICHDDLPRKIPLFDNLSILGIRICSNDPQWPMDRINFEMMKAAKVQEYFKYTTSDILNQDANDFAAFLSDSRNPLLDILSNNYMAPGPEIGDDFYKLYQVTGDMFKSKMALLMRFLLKETVWFKIRFEN